MDEDNKELRNIIDAGDGNLGAQIGKIKTGVVLFYATWCWYSKIALRLLPKLAKEYNNLGFIRVSISEEESDGSRKIIAPETKKSLGIERYPQWAVFQKGIVDINLIVSEKDEEGQLADIRDLLGRIGII